MTRETKIGLLVGLAFIIVMCILLSDHFRSANEPPQAALSSITASVRNAIDEPGAGNPPIVLVPPTDAPPPQSVPTRNELNPPPSPVVPSAVQPAQLSASQNQQAISPASISQVASTASMAPPSIDQPIPDHGADGPGSNSTEALRQVARQHGEALVEIDPNGNVRSLDGGAMPGSTATASLRAYKAVSGDTVSRLAGRFLGANTRTNRQAIIDANPSLQKNVNRIIVGQTYFIPVRRFAAVTPAPTANMPEPTASPAANPAPVHPSIDNSDAQPAPDPAARTRTTAGSSVYTVQEGDSLWAIANDELGDPSAIDAIKELNRGVLRGKNHDVLTPGMKLRLPARS